jgi:hypothetical protein
MKEHRLVIHLCISGTGILTNALRDITSMYLFIWTKHKSFNLSLHQYNEYIPNILVVSFSDSDGDKAVLTLELT